MTREEVFAGIKEIIGIIRPNADVSQIGFDTELVNDLGIDSLAMILLSVAVEEKFHARLNIGVSAPSTVGEVCDVILKAL